MSNPDINRPLVCRYCNIVSDNRVREKPGFEIKEVICPKCKRVMVYAIKTIDKTKTKSKI